MVSLEAVSYETHLRPVIGIGNTVVPIHADSQPREAIAWLRRSPKRGEDHPAKRSADRSPQRFQAAKD